MEAAKARLDEMLRNGSDVSQCEFEHLLALADFDEDVDEDVDKEAREAELTDVGLLDLVLAQGQLGACFSDPAIGEKAARRAMGPQHRDRQ